MTDPTEYSSDDGEREASQEQEMSQSLEEIATLASIRRGLEDMRQNRTVATQVVHDKLRLG
ncbi:hypothetical protein DES53_103245 [Roseimicrobium gellanilyticum]|uniref:Uncharacterized protein n=1 Tax=Roseimicrobium gellanilyticum TaxID=748857 RepID=A0A366HP32_9BACT|nr:hypothetical protein [Roseimicrobium gellanilyticum]RBP45247.1 hypothetical protein DES53_103245 [Roseimicrobium gellanilyticum]